MLVLNQGIGNVTDNDTENPITLNVYINREAHLGNPTTYKKER